MSRRERQHGRTTSAALWMADHPGAAITFFVVLVAVEAVLLWVS